MTTTQTPRRQADHPVTPNEAALDAADERFAEGVRTLRVGAASIRLDERLLMVLGGVLIPLGIIVVLLGWWGAAHSPYVFDQLPYVISGGLLGVGLIFLGAFLYFAHWMTEMVKESRRQSVALLAALDRLEERLSPASAPEHSSNGSGDHDPERWVATQRGTMAHRPDCVVVSGKSGLRAVAPERDGLTFCKLCAQA